MSNSIENNIPAQAKFLKRNMCQSSSKIRADWAKADLIIQLRHDGRVYYPAFQFGKDSRPLPIIKDIIVTLRICLCDWDIAAWFCSYNPIMGGRPSDYLNNQQEKLIEFVSTVCN